MTQQKSLWDWAEEGAAQGETRERTEQRMAMDAVRRDTIKKLRGNSQWATLLRVTRTLPGCFSLNDLSVACHRADPVGFGMRGYSHFPDNHRVHYILYGTRGLIAQGLIERVSAGLFRVRAE
jgi:hypothetical protein